MQRNLNLLHFDNNISIDSLYVFLYIKSFKNEYNINSNMQVNKIISVGNITIVENDIIVYDHKIT